MDLNKDLEAIIRRLQQVGASAKDIQAVQDTFASISKNTQQAETYIKTMTASVERLEEVSAFAQESFASLNTILILNNKEFSKTDDIAKKALRAKRSIVDVSQQLLADEKGINVLTEQQVEKLQQKLKDSLSILKSQKDALISEENFLKLKEKGFDQDKNGNLLSEAALQTKIRSLTKHKELTKEQFKILTTYDKTIDAEKGLLKKTEQTLESKKYINRQMGITGDLIRSASGAMGKLGLNSKIVGDATKEAEEAMRKTAKTGSKLQVMFAGLGPLAKGFGKALTDPATILTFIVKSMLKASSQMADLRKATGLSYKAAYQLRTEMDDLAISTSSNFITSTKLLKAFADMSQYIGQSAHILGGEALKSATYLTQKLKLSTEEAGNLVTMTRLQGASTEDTFTSMGKQLTSFNQANKVAFSLKDQMREVGKASTATVLQLDKSPTALLKAANNAKLLGLNLTQVEKIADSLLDFESSIEAELEAQLMTGQNLNLARARELAMVGDIGGLTEEIGKQEAIRNAFATKNVFAQNATAKALGISRDELAKMALQQDLNTMSAENFKKEYGEVTYESLKATSAQDKFNYALEKMQDVLGTIFMRLSFVIDGFAAILEMPFAGHILAGAVALKVLGGSFGGVLKLGKGLLGTISSIGKKATDAATTVADTTSNIPKTPPTQPKSPGSSIIESFNKLDTKSLIRAAGAMAILSVALYISAKAFQEFATVEWESVAMGLTGMIGLAAVAKIISKGSKEMIMGAAAIGILGLAMIPLAYALNQMAGVNIEGVLAAAAGLVIFSAAAFALGSLFSSGIGAVLFGAGLVGIMALAVAIEPLGKALTGAAPGFTAFGNAMQSLTMESAKALAVTGVGLVALGAGLISLSAASLLGSPLGTLTELAALAPSLATVGTSLTAIAAGIVALSAALNSLETTKLDELKDLVITTAFAAPMIAATGAITELISGISGDSQSDSNNKEIVAKLDELINATKTRPVMLNVDGTAFYNTLEQSTFKSA